jgi:pimeloyl-ACP methyl ester carboxylesterase
MLEKAYKFGKDDCLIGIISEPDANPATKDNVAVVVLNAGWLHHVGPHRLHVELARDLAYKGFRVLRFDLSGIGDSEVRLDGVPYKERAVADIRDAMDFLSEKQGHSNFVLVGLCSGSDNAHLVAVEDPRVSGIVSLDGHGYRTWGFCMHYVKGRTRDLCSLRKWKNLIRRSFSKSSREEIFRRAFPPKEKARSDLERLVERGVNLLYVYSGDAMSYYNYGGQLQDAFRGLNLRGKVHVERFKEADHLFTLCTDRGKLVHVISEWMQACYNV